MKVLLQTGSSGRAPVPPEKRFLISFSVGALARDTVLPFSIQTKVQTENLPTYVSPPLANLYNSNPILCVGWGIDSPIGCVLIDGRLWVMFNSGNQYGTVVKVARFVGSDFEHTTRKEDGTIEVEKGVSTHFCGGLWYDADSGTLYAPIHCEYKNAISPPAGWARKKVRLATSTDKGLTWRMVGDILTASLSGDEDWLKYSGSYFEAGPGDFDFYADSLGGYFYLFTCNAYAPKNGRMNNFLWFNEAARCRISDKMAPGKWWKFCNGRWNEPGLGGKSSRIAMDTYGIYGRVIYSTYLKTYLRIGPTLGFADSRFTDTGFTDGSIYLSVCDDLAKQQWSAKIKLLNQPKNKKLGITVTDGQAKNPFICDNRLRIYHYWLYDLPSEAIDVTFSSGATAVEAFPAFSSYAFEPIPESGDPIVARHTKIVGSNAKEVEYRGEGWKTTKHAGYYRGVVKESDRAGHSVLFSWKGDAIYWRAVAAKDAGMADIYIDGKFQTTVDCYYQESLPYQFAYIKTGLEKKKHRIEIRIKSEKNPLSVGTMIRHMAFEYDAESYTASAGYSGVQGKNNWWYRCSDESGDANLEFLFAVKDTEASQTGKEKFSYPNQWGSKELCIIGNDYQIPGGRDAVRAWMAPRSGRVRIEGLLELESGKSGAADAFIMKNEKIIWPPHSVAAGPPRPHDFFVTVRKGDVVSFVIKKKGAGSEEKVIWDPVITYRE